MSQREDGPRRRTALAELLGALPDVLLVLDPKDLAILDLNREAGAFGHRRDTLLGRPFSDLVPSSEALERAFDTALSGTAPGIVETRVRHADGTELPVELRISTARFAILAVLRERDPGEVGAAAFLDAIVENIPDMIFVKDAETLLFERFNRAGEELLGWTRGELLGKTDHDFYPKEQADFFHAKDRETLRNKVLVDIPEEPIQTKGKGLRWLHTKKVPVLDERGIPRHLLGISEDITARKAAEERARALEGEIAALVENAQDAIVAWTEDGKIAAWNPAAERLYGIPARDAVGTELAALVPEDERPALAEVQARLRRGEAVPLAEATRLRNGQPIEVEESRFLVRRPDGSVRYAAIARDVSEVARLKRAAEILGRPRSATEPGAPRSKRMKDALAAAEVVAKDPNASVLILGETGVGKNWLARQIHDLSPRAAKPFFEVNCASLGPQLVESELFGHERGAFTGATLQKRGIVEVAEGGTLFLDEIGELPAGVQAQLLTFLDTRVFRRVGGTRTIVADVRLLAATNANLKSLADKGSFRRDLYYRLSVMPIEVPPLRERRDEIPALARAIAADLARRAGRNRATLDRAFVAALQHHDWPGNVRELRNAIERALIVARGAPLELAHLPPEIRGEPGPRSAAPERLEDAEREHILRVLESAGQNRTLAAKRLGISRSTLKRKLAEMGRGEDPAEREGDD